MRILFVNTAREMGGGITSAVELARGLGARGHALVVACHPAGGIHQRLRGEADVRVLPLALRAELNPVRPLQLAAILRDTRPEVVLADRRKDVKLSVLARTLPGAPRPPVVHRHGAPSVLRDSRTYRAVWTRLQMMIVNSEWMRSALLDATPWLAEVPLRVIHNGKDTGVFRPHPEQRAAVRASLGIPDEAFVPCFHGVLQARKRVDVLIAALRLLSDSLPVHGLIVGDGPDASALRELATGASVTFTGPRNDVPIVLAAADAAVHLSDSEGFSNAVLEAMACELPVVASAATSHPEQITEAVHGFLVPPGDSAAVAERLRQLFERPAERARLGRAARERVVTEFSLEAMLSAYEAALEAAIAERR